MARVLSVIKFTLSFLLLLSSLAAEARDLEKQYEKAQFKIDTQAITAYLADTDDKREAGLMYIEKLGPNQGMLFAFDDERPLAFWMKNTLIPLAIGFLNKDAKLVDEQEMEVPRSMMTPRPPSYESKGPAQLALEMKKGWFKEHNVKEGAKLCRTSETKSKATNALVPLCR